MKTHLPLLLAFAACLPASGQTPATPPAPAPAPSAGAPAASPATPSDNTPATPPQTGTAPASQDAVARAFQTVRGHAEALSRSTAGLTGLTLLQAYLGIVHADAALVQKADVKQVDLQIVRTMSMLGSAKAQLNQLKGAMAGQKGFEKFIAEGVETAELLEALANEVRLMAAGKKDRETGPYLKKREETRAHLLRFTQFVDNRDLLP